MRLHGYFRSGAAYRVRVALNLKGLVVDHVSHHLRRGEQQASSYLALNPQGLVPALELHDGTVLTQSLAIIEWLDETWPQPALLPADPIQRARVRAFALAIAADTHPVQNLRILRRIEEIAASDTAGQTWAMEVNQAGLAACEHLIAAEPGPFCFGGAPTLADVCLVPQLGNARRFGADVRAFPRLLQAEAAALALEAFAAAAPERQPDSE